MLLGTGALAESEYFEPAALATMIRNRIAAPKGRDLQVEIGPSSVGDPCARCIGDILKAKLPGGRIPRPQRFSLPPWIGTGVHLLLEHVMAGVEGWQGERRLYCGDIKGWNGNPDYGEVHGSCDGYHEPSATVVDWKIVGDNTIKKVKAGQTSTTYAYQKQTYARGFDWLGLPVKHVMNVYIPRNGRDERDILFDVDAYDPTMAEEAFDRAAQIWNEYVLTDRVSWLESDPDCFSCNRFDPPPVNMKGLARRGSKAPTTAN